MSLLISFIQGLSVYKHLFCFLLRPRLKPAPSWPSTVAWSRRGLLGSSVTLETATPSGIEGSEAIEEEEQREERSETEVKKEEKS